MKSLIPLSLLIGTTLATPAFALDMCQPTSEDAQVRICNYNSDQRYAVNGVVGFPVNLKFGDLEKVQRLDFADTGLSQDGSPRKSWKGPGGPEKKATGAAPVAKPINSFLPIWPLKDGHSALTVVTITPEGKERPYLFDLTARLPSENCGQVPSGPECPDDITTTTGLTFAYPIDVAAAKIQDAEAKKQAAVSAWHVRQDKQKEKIAVDRLKTDVFYGDQNKDYGCEGDPKYKATLCPPIATDNGWLTEMQWPGNVQIPTITVVDPATGEERNPAIEQQGRMRIISTTAVKFRLRLGPKAVVDVNNHAWRAERPDPDTGTTSPDVVRTVTYRNNTP